MHPFLFCFYDFLIFCVIVWFFIPICFICLFPVFGWMHFLCVLSLPVQCWSLSYGKQRRPFRLCAPTWLRQQVWRTFNFFSTWTLFCYSFLSFCQRIPFGEWCSASFQIYLIYSQFLRERSALSGEKKLQVKPWNSGGGFISFLIFPFWWNEWRMNECVPLNLCENIAVIDLVLLCLRSLSAHWRKEP